MQIVNEVTKFQNQMKASNPCSLTKPERSIMDGASNQAKEAKSMLGMCSTLFHHQGNDYATQ